VVRQTHNAEVANSWSCGNLTSTVMNETTCPACNIEMEQIEKTTFTGREMREYQCPRCKRTQIVDCGEALWKILSDANKPPDET
jgi:transposase-like protein